MKKSVLVLLSPVFLLPFVSFAQPINWTSRKNIVKTDYLGIVDWNSTKWLWRASGTPSFSLQLQGIGWAQKITYVSFDNSMWTAHQKEGRQNHETGILVHAPNDDQSKAHDDTRINYVNWSGINQSAWLRTGNYGGDGTWNSTPNENDGGIHDLKFINLYGADGNKWTVSVFGQNFLIAKGVQGPLWQAPSVLKFIGWDGAQWNALIQPDHSFKIYNATTSNISQEIHLNSSEGQHLAVKFTSDYKFVVATEDPNTKLQLPSKDLTLKQPSIDPAHPPVIPRPVKHINHRG